MRINKLILVFSLLLAACGTAAAQSAGEVAQVRSNHSISITTLGVSYNYEQRLGGNWSIIGRAGLAATEFDISSHLDDFSASFQMGYGVSIEPRCYTSLGRRAANFKTTANNSSDFVSVRAQFLSDGEREVLSLTPMYGIRRSGGKHWFHEFSFGGRLSLTNDFDIRPYVQYRLGFIF